MRLEDFPDEICAWCGGGYESRHPMQKYCCYECRRQSVAAFMKAVHRDSQARATKGKTCQQCGKTFDAFKRNQKYCSRRCGGDAWIARHLVPATRKRMAARAGRVCQSCGATFDARRDSQLCCSKRCRERVRHGRTRTLNCVECGAAIPTSRRAHAKTCSLRCQKRNWNKRNREKVREQARRRYAARRAGNMQICPIAMSPRARWRRSWRKCRRVRTSIPKFRHPRFTVGGVSNVLVMSPRARWDSMAMSNDGHARNREGSL